MSTKLYDQLVRIIDIDKTLTHSYDTRLIYANIGKLVEEVAEINTAWLAMDGYIDKELKEPIINEIADAIICLTTLVVRLEPNMDTHEALNGLLEALDKKIPKYADKINYLREKRRVCL